MSVMMTKKVQAIKSQVNGMANIFQFSVLEKIVVSIEAHDGEVKMIELVEAWSLTRVFLVESQVDVLDENEEDEQDGDLQFPIKLVGANRLADQLGHEVRLNEEGAQYEVDNDGHVVESWQMRYQIIQRTWKWWFLEASFSIESDIYRMKRVAFKSVFSMRLNPDRFL